MANDFVDKADLASTAHGKGASMVGIEDAGGRIAADNVEDALQEILTVAENAAADIGTKATSAQLASEAHGAGAALIGIEDSANNFAGGNVEAALTQLANTTEDHETRIAFNETDITTLFEEVGLKQTASDLSSTAHGSGASQVGIEDASGLFTSTTVEGALHELAIGGGGGGGDVTLAILASHAGGEGASLIGIQDVGGLITATQTEGALAEIVVKANTGITNAATAQSTANAAMPTATLASTTLGQGASLVGIHDTAGIITATTAEGAFAEIAANVALRPLTTDLASTLISKGASLIGINDTGGFFTSGQVEAALQELAAKSPPSGFFATHAGNPARYAAPYGNDANDGYSWYTPKEHVLAAYDALPVGGGSIYIADNTYVGGEVAGQGVWLSDSTVLFPGWRRTKNVNWYGMGGSQGQFAFPIAHILRGRAGDVTKPTARYDVGLWVTNNHGFAMTFNNLGWLDYSIGLRVGCDDDPSHDPDVIRGSDFTTAMLHFSKCDWQSNGVGSDVGEGPVVDMGYFLWVYFDQCGVENNTDIPLLSDRRALFLIKPSDGSSLFQLENCRGGNGGIIYYNGPSGWSFKVDDWLVEAAGVALPSLFKAVGLSEFGHGFLSSIIGADDLGSEDRIVLEDTQDGFLPTALTVINCPGSKAPAITLGTDESSVAEAAFTPASLGQVGFVGNRIIGNSDIARFASPIISNRYKGLIPMRSGTGGDTGPVVNPPVISHSANRVWTQRGANNAGGGGTVVDSAIKDHNGGDNGIRISTNDGSSAFQKFFFTTRPVVVGDYFIVGGWFRFPTDPMSGTVLSMTLTNGDLVPPTHILDRSGEIRPTYKGNGEWSWIQGYSKITSLGVTTSASVNVVVNADVGHPTDVSGMTLLHIHLADVAENEIAEILQNMQPWQSLPQGVASTQPGQVLIAQGGIGVGNSITSGITLSSATRLMEVFDSRGAPLGFLEIKQEVAPGTPKIYFDSQSVDGLSNSTEIDASLISDFENTGSLGAAADLATIVDIFGDHAPTFKQTAKDNKIKNQSSVTAVNEDKMMSPAFAAITQPFNVIALFRNNQTPDVVPAALVTQTSVGPALIDFAATTYHLRLNAGTLVDTGVVPSNDTFHTLAVTFNGAASTGELDGVTLGTFDAGANSLAQIGIFVDQSGGNNYFYGDLIALMVYDDGTSRADAVAFLARKYGSTPQ